MTGQNAKKAGKRISATVSAALQHEREHTGNAARALGRRMPYVKASLLAARPVVDVKLKPLVESHSEFHVGGGEFDFDEDVDD